MPEDKKTPNKPHLTVEAFWGFFFCEDLNILYVTNVNSKKKKKEKNWEQTAEKK